MRESFHYTRTPFLGQLLSCLLLFPTDGPMAWNPRPAIVPCVCKKQKPMQKRCCFPQNEHRPPNLKQNYIEFTGCCVYFWLLLSSNLNLTNCLQGQKLQQSSGLVVFSFTIALVSHSHSLHLGLPMESLHLFPDFQKTLPHLIVLGYGNIWSNSHKGKGKPKEAPFTCHWYRTDCSFCQCYLMYLQ